MIERCIGGSSLSCSTGQVNDGDVRREVVIDLGRKTKISEILSIRTKEIVRTEKSNDAFDEQNA